MSKKTVAQLDSEVQILKQEAGNVSTSSHFVYNWEQVAKVLEEYDRYGELVKFELVHANLPDRKRSYHIIVWHRPLLNLESRQEDVMRGDFYQALRDTKEHI